jgi:hypothetical protein
MFHMVLTINSSYFLKQHKPVGLYSRHSVFPVRYKLNFYIDTFQPVNSQYYTRIKVFIFFFFCITILVLVNFEIHNYCNESHSPRVTLQTLNKE